MAHAEETLAAEFSRQRSRLLRSIQYRIDPRLAGRVDADDILQEAYLDAAQRFAGFQQSPSVSLFVWLRKIVGQTMVNVFRRHLMAGNRSIGREQRRVRPTTGATSISLAAQFAARLTSPSQAAMRGELAEQLESALGQLKPIDREILLLRHFEECTNTETAELLGIEPKAASIRYIRAVGRLKDVLGKIADEKSHG